MMIQSSLRTIEEPRALWTLSFDNALKGYCTHNPQGISAFAVSGGTG